MKRLRPVNSCLPCRNRRLKCDKEHPYCGRCRQNNQRCVYIQSPVVTASAPDPELTHQISGTSDETPVSETTQGPNTSSGQPTGERGRFSVSYGGRTSYNGATFWGNAIPADVANIDSFFEAPATPPAPVNASSTQPMNDGMTSFYGPFRLPPNSNLAIPTSMCNTCRMCGRGYRLSCIQAMLPDRSICEKLCLIFFGKVFSLIPILHLPSFRTDFDELWKHLNSSKPCQNQVVAPVLRRKPGLLCLVFSMMFSVLYCTSESTLKAAFGGPLPDISTRTCYLALMVVARLTGFPRRPTPYTLAAYIYAQSQFAREEEFRDAPEFVGMSFRLAIGMGLHRQLHDVVLEAGELETRQRLWWYILHLDVMVSCSSGLPPLFIDDKMSNANMINTFDEYFDSTKRVVERKNDIRYIVAAKRYEASKEMRNILRLHFEDAFEDRAVLSTLEIQLKSLADGMSRTCDGLLKMYSSCSLSTSVCRSPEGDGLQSGFSRIWNVQPDQACDKEAVNFALWSVTLLHMMVYKTYCVLYHPLFYQSSSDDIDVGVNASAVRHAQSFLHLFVRLCNQPCSEPFRWMYPGTYQPLQALALLVADLLRNPRSDTSETSRGVVDRIFEMYSIDHGIVNPNEPVKRNLTASGRDAWLMLARARRQALEKIGEDPHILVPSRDEDMSKCLCGQSIDMPVVGMHDVEVHSMSGLDASQRLQSSDLQAAGPDDPQLTMSQENFGDPFMGDTEFDWRDFETIAGAASSYVS